MGTCIEITSPITDSTRKVRISFLGPRSSPCEKIHTFRVFLMEGGSGGGRSGWGGVWEGSRFGLRADFLGAPISFTRQFFHAPFFLRAEFFARRFWWRASGGEVWGTVWGGDLGDEASLFRREARSLIHQTNSRSPCSAGTYWYNNI